MEDTRALRDLLDVVYDLAAAMQSDWAAGRLTADLADNSRDRCSTVQDWALEFDRLHAKTDWTEVDYLETVDDFYRDKISPYLADKTAVGQISFETAGREGESTASVFRSHGAEAAAGEDERELVGALDRNLPPPANNVFDYFTQKLGQEPYFTPNTIGLRDFPLESVCGKGCQQIIDKAVDLLAECDEHPEVVNSIRDGVTVAIEIVCFG
jgi:hypothetical protein